MMLAAGRAGRRGIRRILPEGITTLGVCYTMYLFSTSFDFLSVASGVSIARLTAVALVVACVLSARKMRFSFVSATAYLYLLVLCGFVGLLVLEDPASGLNPFFSLALNVTIALFALWLPFGRGDADLCERALLLSSATMCVLLFVSPGTVGSNWATDRVVVNIAGSQQDANEFCGYLIFAAGFFTYSAIRKGRWWHLAFVAVVFYAAMLTGSRGGVIAVIVAFLAAFAFGFRETGRKTGWIVAAIVLAAIVVANMDAILAMLPPSVSSRFQNIDVQGGHGWAAPSRLGRRAGGLFLLRPARAAPRPRVRLHNLRHLQRPRRPQLVHRAPLHARGRRPRALHRGRGLRPRVAAPSGAHGRGRVARRLPRAHHVALRLLLQAVLGRHERRLHGRLQARGAQ